MSVIFGKSAELETVRPLLVLACAVRPVVAAKVRCDMHRCKRMARWRHVHVDLVPGTGAHRSSGGWYCDDHRPAPHDLDVRDAGHASQEVDDVPARTSAYEQGLSDARNGRGCYYSGPHADDYLAGATRGRREREAAEHDAE